MHKAIYLPLSAYTTLYYEDKHHLPFYIHNQQHEHTSIKILNFTVNVVVGKQP